MGSNKLPQTTQEHKIPQMKLKQDKWSRRFFSHGVGQMFAGVVWPKWPKGKKKVAFFVPFVIPQILCYTEHETCIRFQRKSIIYIWRISPWTDMLIWSANKKKTCNSPPVPLIPMKCVQSTSCYFIHSKQLSFTCIAPNYKISHLEEFYSVNTKYIYMEDL